MKPTYKPGEIVRLPTIDREEVVLVRFWESDDKNERWEVKDTNDKLFPIWIPRRITRRTK